MSLPTLDAPTIKRHFEVVLQKLDDVVTHREAVFDDEQVAPTQYSGCRFFVELAVDARLERVADLVFSPDECVTRGRLIRRPLNEHVAVSNDNRRHANANDVSPCDGLEEIALSGHGH